MGGMLRVLVGVTVAGLAHLALPLLGAAAPASPVLLSPSEGATLTTFGPRFFWTNPLGTTQYHFQLIPVQNDGPGVDVQIGSADASFAIPAPPAWYGLLPDMTYTWRLRVSDSPAFASVGDSSWSAWVERRVRSPAVSSATISEVGPGSGIVARTLTPTLQWSNTRTDVFYYELQLSKDPAFDVNPATATATVYTALLHGGVTLPRRSYSVPVASPLEDKTVYYWRVRPRVQGDGNPLAWSKTFTFSSDTAVPPALTVEKALFSIAETHCEFTFTSGSFASAPDLTGVRFAYRYKGSGKALHSWYRDGIPAGTFPETLPEDRTCRVGSFVTALGGPDEAAPLRPGTYTLEVWHAGETLQRTEFVVTPSPTLQFGTMILGTGAEDPTGCKLSGVSTRFPEQTPGVWARFNWVGTGSFELVLARGGLVIDRRPFEAARPADCALIPVRLSENGLGSAWSLSLNAGGQTKQTVTFSVG